MQLGMVGLGRMGANMVERLREGGHECVAFDRNPQAVASVAAAGAKGCSSLADLVRALAPPRHVWIMLPAGVATNSTIDELAKLLERGDAIIDGGNSYWKEAQAHARDLAPKGISFVDAGVSGGIWGLKIGYCLMVGGDAEVCKRLEPIFLTLAPKDGYLRTGPVRRAFREDGPQRHRVRHAARLRRGLRGARSVGVRQRARPREGLALVEPGQCHPLVAAGISRAGI